MPTSRSFTSVKEQHNDALCTHNELSDLSLVCFIVLYIESLQHTNGCHLQAVMTSSEIFHGDFIKILVCKNHGCSLQFFDEVFGCLCFRGIFTVIFSCIGFHAKLLEYYICLCVTGQKGTNMKGCAAEQ